MNHEYATKAITLIIAIAIADECTCVVSIPNGATAADAYRISDLAFTGLKPRLMSTSETRPPVMPPTAPASDGIQAYLPISARLNPRAVLK